jgi:hypothetical protein
VNDVYSILASFTSSVFSRIDNRFFLWRFFLYLISKINPEYGQSLRMKSDFLEYVGKEIDP